MLVMTDAAGGFLTRVLLVDKSVAEALGSSVLDVEKTLNGAKLILLH